MFAHVCRLVMLLLASPQSAGNQPVEHASPLAGGIYYCGTANSTTAFDQAVPRGGGACVGHQHLRRIKNPSHAEQVTAWHDALRVVLRSAGRKPFLTKQEMERICLGAAGCSNCSCLHSGYHLLAWTLTQQPPLASGLWLEFGVYTGSSLNITADARTRIDGGEVHGFDSFEGLPTAWKVEREASNVVSSRASSSQAASSVGVIKKGSFSLGGHLPPVRSNAVLHKGLFSTSLPTFLAGRPVAEAVTYVSIDMDLYQGAIDVLHLLKPRMRGAHAVDAAGTDKRAGHVGGGGTLIHFHELLHATSTADSGKPMDEARALFDWLLANPSMALKLIPIQARPRDEAAVFRVLRAR